MESLDCKHYQKEECRQCGLHSSYSHFLEEKTIDLHQLFPTLELVPSRWRESRYRAKFAVGFKNGQILLGAPDSRGQVQASLNQCELYPAELKRLLAHLPRYFSDCRLSIYDVEKQTGELKFVQLQQTTTGELLLTLLLRSRESLERLQKNLPGLQEKFPALKVVAVGLIPRATSVQQAQELLYLTEARSLRECLNGVNLLIGANSFFQTNPFMAAELYKMAQEWAQDLAGQKSDHHFIDAYSGVGGFAFHLAQAGLPVIAHEVDAQATELARQAAVLNGFQNNINFLCSDLESQAIELADHCLIVNPPRRGLSRLLIDKIQASRVPHVFYSSCNPETLRRDLLLLDKFQLSKATALDMFPMNQHLEVAVTLVRK
jgi:23S rRNA (uracil747-C5)-methyltransferase